MIKIFIIIQTFIVSVIIVIITIIIHISIIICNSPIAAVCKNSADDKWYNFDDSKVEVTAEENVVTPDAYILFYQV